MTSIFNFNNNDDDDEYIDKIDLDELYEKKKLNDLQKLNIYKNILSRVHNRIRVTSRQSKDNLCCWYVIPEMIIGVSTTCVHLSSNARSYPSHFPSFSIDVNSISPAPLSTVSFNH